MAKYIQQSPLDMIHNTLESLSTAERKVAEFVLENAAVVATSTVSDTAAAAGVSEATVVRFCRSVGYRGYLDFRFALTQMLGDPMHSLNAEIQPTDGIEQIAEHTIYATLASLRDTLNLIDLEQMETAVAAAKAARYILIVGVGTSAPFATDLYNKLIRLGLHCEAILDPYIQLTRAALLTSEDMLIALTHSGASIEPVDTMRHAKKQGATTLAITGTVPSPITAHADIVLQYDARETRLEPLIARIAQLAVCDIFFLALTMQDIVRADENEKKIWELVITLVEGDDPTP